MNTTSTMSNATLTPPVSTISTRANHYEGKQQMFDLTNPSVYFFKREISYKKGPNGPDIAYYNTFCYESYDDFLHYYHSLPEESRCLYSLIPYGVPVREYVDIDYAVDKSMTYKEMCDKTDNIVMTYLQARSAVGSVSLQKQDIVVNESHRAGKISVRLFSKKTFFHSNREQQDFAKRIFDILEKFQEIDWNIDTAVYSRNRNMRLFGCSKVLKKIPLRLCLEQTFGFVEEEKELIYISGITLKPEDLEHMQHERIHENCRYYGRGNGTVDTGNDWVSSEPHGEAEGLVREWAKENHPEFEVDGQRLNRTVRTCCFIDPSDTHSTENGYWFERKGLVFVGCFTHDSHVCINRENPILNEEDEEIAETKVEEVEREKTQFLHATHHVNTKYIGDLRKRIPGLLQKRTILLKCPMGVGKTTSVFAAACAFYDNILVISHRITLIKELVGKYGFEDYLDKKFDAPRLVCCLNSLDKLSNPEQYSCIIVDEVSSVLRQTNMADKELRVSTGILCSYFESDKVMYMMDGNLSNSDVDFIKEARQNVRVGGTLVQNTTDDFVTLYSNRNNNKKIIIYDNFKVVEEKCIQDIKDGKKVCIPFSFSVDRITAMVKANASVFENIRWEIIHKENKSSKVLDHQFWSTLDVLFYSPTISEGVSFELDYFDVIYQFATIASCPPSSVIQATARVRSVTEIHLYLDDRECNRKPHHQHFYSAKELEEFYVKNMKDFVGTNINFGMQNFQLSIVKDFYWKLFSKNKLELDNEYNTFRESLYQGYIDNGYTVFSCTVVDNDDEDAIKNHKQKYTKAKKEAKQEAREAIANAEVVSIHMKKALEAKVDKNTAEWNVLKRLTIADSLKVNNVTTDTVKFYEKNIHKLNNMRNVLEVDVEDEKMHLRDPSALSVLGYGFMARMKAVDGRSFQEQRDAFTDLKCPKIDFLMRSLETLGFCQHSINDRVEEKEFLQHMVTLLNQSDKYYQYRHVQRIFNTHCGKERFDDFVKVIAEIKQLIEHGSAKLKKDAKERKEKEKENPKKKRKEVLTIKDSWGFINDKLAYIGMKFVAFDGFVYIAPLFELNVFPDADKPSLLLHDVKEDNEHDYKEVTEELNEFFARAKRHCDVCKKDIKGGCWGVHQRTAAHLKNVEKPPEPIKRKAVKRRNQPVVYMLTCASKRDFPENNNIGDEFRIEYVEYAEEDNDVEHVRLLGNKKIKKTRGLSKEKQAEMEAMYQIMLKHDLNDALNDALNDDPITVV